MRSMPAELTVLTVLKVLLTVLVLTPGMSLIGEIMVSSEGVRECVVCPTDITVKKALPKVSDTNRIRTSDARMKIQRIIHPATLAWRPRYQDRISFAHSAGSKCILAHTIALAAPSEHTSFSTIYGATEDAFLCKNK